MTSKSQIGLIVIDYEHEHRIFYVNDKENDIINKDIGKDILEPKRIIFK